MKRAGELRESGKKWSTKTGQTSIIYHYRRAKSISQQVLKMDSVMSNSS